MSVRVCAVVACREHDELGSFGFVFERERKREREEITPEGGKNVTVDSCYNASFMDILQCERKREHKTDRNTDREVKHTRKTERKTLKREEGQWKRRQIKREMQKDGE